MKTFVFFYQQKKIFLMSYIIDWLGFYNKNKIAIEDSKKKGGVDRGDEGRMNLMSVYFRA